MTCPTGLPGACHRCGGARDVREDRRRTCRRARSRDRASRFETIEHLITPSGQPKCWTSGSRSSCHRARSSRKERPDRADPAPTFVGTPAYMSPEQIQGARWTRRRKRRVRPRRGALRIADRPARVSGVTAIGMPRESFTSIPRRRPRSGAVSIPRTTPCAARCWPRIPRNGASLQSKPPSSCAVRRPRGRIDNPSASSSLRQFQNGGGPDGPGSRARSQSSRC